MKLNQIIFADEITLWWEKEWDLPDGIVYSLSCGEASVRTDKTHATFEGLTPDTDYGITLTRESDGEILANHTLHTPCAKKRICLSVCTTMPCRTRPILLRNRWDIRCIICICTVLN